MKVHVASNPDKTIGAVRQKRLGQYFTGTGLGRLLAALAKADKAKTIIDPMVGTGDLLVSCLEIGANPAQISGIEIDGLALTACKNRLPMVSCLFGNVFDPDVISRLPTQEWDLVIANPPYVRYQSLSDKTDTTHTLPTAMQVRTGLLNIIQQLHALDDEDKRIFGTLVSSYSGLSDLAVPSWILCAALVKKGGRIALVAPESWLSRDYATIVHYLLMRWFDIEFVVEDEHASWFDNAQVKATLIIAKRVKRRDSNLSQPEGRSYCHITISAAAASSESPIGQIKLSGKAIEKSFAKQARKWLHDVSRYSDNLIQACPVSVKLAYKNALAAASHQKWFTLVGKVESLASENIYVPHELHDWLSRHQLCVVFDTFESQGVRVGQGLRTGANGFFYADGERVGNDVLLKFSGPLSGLTAKVPSNIIKSVVRRQSDLPNSFAVSPETTKGYALDLRGYVLPDDMEINNLLSTPYKPMPIAAAAVVRAAVCANFGTLEKPQKVFELTAVSTNVRPASRSVPARYWYMLPDFAPRHMPDVLLARVNSKTPKAYINIGRECLIDANFSTMWTQTTSKWTANALLAFMNSAWAKAVIEYSGSVMGGGALKVEATHLRRVPVPILKEYQLRELDTFGARLAMDGGGDETMAAIDAIIASSLGCDKRETMELKSIAHAGQIRRAKHKKKRGLIDGN